MKLLSRSLRKGNCLASILLLSPLLLPLVPTSIAAQERQGCYMINAGGRLIDLGELCPVATPFQTTGTPQLGTGDIQVTLRWASSDDLDLAVTDPSGNTVTYSNPRVASGGQLDVDANAGCGEITPTPIENIFWLPGQAAQGEYSIAVNLYQRCGSGSEAIPFNLTLLVQGNTRTLNGTVNDQNPVANFPFAVGAGATQAARAAAPSSP
ncbi:hypothetical protein NDI45_20090 [Leptolyngbya sp. GB1-A1]|uniref:hypothetical protein n=1 Tax=Leptolyngbya sp. GB1-A1 TaxID=2933908 RepID=UPI0032991F23